MATISKLHWSSVPKNESLARFAIWPEPIDADACFQAAGFCEFADSDEEWRADFARLIQRIVKTFSVFGHGALTAGEMPHRGKNVGTIYDAIEAVAMDDQFPPCVLDFGKTSSARVSVSDGHPIFWIELADATLFPNLLKHIAGDLPCVETTLNWEVLLPERPV